MKNEIKNWNVHSLCVGIGGVKTRIHRQVGKSKSFIEAISWLISRGSK